MIRKYPGNHIKVLLAAVILLVLVTAVLIFFSAKNGKSNKTSDENETHMLEVVPKSKEKPSSLLTSDTDKLKYINSHTQYYPEELVSIANKNSETIDFVYDFAFRNANTDIDLSAEAESDTVPRLMQWDKRWGYDKYSGGHFACTGCGPTCLSMVALYLTGNAEYTPPAVAEYAEKNGYAEGKNGTSWSLMSEGCANFGLSAQELPLDKDSIISALNSGKPIILIMGKGVFTESGHYIVLTGYDNGAFTINDPNSIERSEKKWTYDDISSQIRNIWAYSTEYGENEKSDVKVFFAED